MSPAHKLNATFAQSLATPGNVALLSQSGALLTAILDHAGREGIGFSFCASLGSMVDVGWGDLIRYLGTDPQTKSIVIYMESVIDASSFLSAARDVALVKPIIVIKAGRSREGAKAAASHTGALTGSDAVLDAALDRVGVLRASSLSDTLDALNNILPAAWSHGNPIDLLGDALADRYENAFRVATQDPGTDSLLVILTPQAMTEATKTAEALAPYAKSLGKPVFAVWMGGETVEAGRKVLIKAGIPTFPFPEEALTVFNALRRYAENHHEFYDSPGLEVVVREESNLRAKQIIDRAMQQQHTLLTEDEAKSVLASYDFPIVLTHIALTEEDAVAAANDIGYPVVLKIRSHSITHKTDVGGVRLNVADADAVRKAFRGIRRDMYTKAPAALDRPVMACDFLGVTVQPMVQQDGYELILGVSADSQFGPVLLFGTGGRLVEVYQDTALGLPPLNRKFARRMIERTHISTALKGIRGHLPIDMPQLELLLIRFSQLVVDQPRIREIDINPLLISPDRMVVLDARVTLYPVHISDDRLPYPALCSRYPSRISCQQANTLSIVKHHRVPSRVISEASP